MMTKSPEELDTDASSLSQRATTGAISRRGSTPNSSNDQSVSSVTSSIFACIDSAVMYDAQIFASFATAFDFKLSSNEFTMWELIMEHRTEAECVVPSISALAWSHASASHPNNMQLQVQARSRYGTALKCVATDVGAVAQSRQSEGFHLAVFDSIMLLCQFQFRISSGSPATADRALLQHLRGTQQYAKVYGQATEEWDKRFKAIWLSSYSVSLALRQQGPWNLQDWEACPIPIYVDMLHTDSWFRLALPLPGLLEATDAMLIPDSASATTANVRELVIRLNRLRTQVHAWVTLHVPLEKLATENIVFDTTIEELKMWSENESFTSANYISQPYRYAAFVLMSRIICIIADCAILRLQNLVSLTDGLWELAIHRDTKKDAYAMACNMCEDVYWASQLGSLALTSMLRTSVDVAARFFRDYGASAELEFCRACGEATDRRVQRLRQKGARSLCRIEAVAPLFVESASYK